MAGQSAGDLELVRLEAEARYARERYQLYRAKSYGPSATNPARLRELDGERVRAEARLRRARTVPEHN
jgi:hypothetical protein